MLIKLEQHTSQKDIEVLITYPVKNKIVDRIVSLIKTVDTQIECYSDDIMKLINVSLVYYIESIDKKTIVFCEKENYLVRSRLYQIYERLKDNGFVQISKHCILNINMLENIKPLANSRLEAVLSNGICLHVTRKYLANLKKVLREDEQ
ncbi:MAG: LytTR family transcriptional regulator [Treponema sp.]|jgi:DNA-binding LytR/AlgR family response regulator|nr:LytTR family transcriptional regulator [Treponema sp.]